MRLCKRILDSLTVVPVYVFFLGIQYCCVVSPLSGYDIKLLAGGELELAETGLTYRSVFMVKLPWINFGGNGVVFLIYPYLLSGFGILGLDIATLDLISFLYTKK